MDELKQDKEEEINVDEYKTTKYIEIRKKIKNQPKESSNQINEGTKITSKEKKKK